MAFCVCTRGDKRNKAIHLNFRLAKLRTSPARQLNGKIQIQGAKMRMLSLIKSQLCDYVWAHNAKGISTRRALFPISSRAALLIFRCCPKRCRHQHAATEKCWFTRNDEFCASEKKEWNDRLAVRDKDAANNGNIMTQELVSSPCARRHFFFISGIFVFITSFGGLGGGVRDDDVIRVEVTSHRKLRHRHQGFYHWWRKK